MYRYTYNNIIVLTYSIIYNTLGTIHKHTYIHASIITHAYPHTHTHTHTFKNTYNQTSRAYRLHIFTNTSHIQTRTHSSRIHDHIEYTHTYTHAHSRHLSIPTHAHAYSFTYAYNCTHARTKPLRGRYTAWTSHTYIEVHIYYIVGIIVFVIEGVLTPRRYLSS